MYPQKLDKFMLLFNLIKGGRAARQPGSYEVCRYILFNASILQAAAGNCMQKWAINFNSIVEVGAKLLEMISECVRVCD